MLRQAIALVLLAFVPAIGQAFYFRDGASWQAPVPASEMVTVEKARAWGDNAFWVDARAEEDFSREHIPGAILLNEDHWDELLPQFHGTWSPGKKVVVYCSSQSCNLALEVARRLRNQTQPPMQDVYVLKGGWEEWLKSK